VTLPWKERVPAISVNPEMATTGDIARLASELAQARHTLHRIAYDPVDPNRTDSEIVARMRELAREALEEPT
jgi:hypothetical protein